MKKILICTAAIGLMLTGCVKDEVLDVNPQSPDAIGFMATTTKASISYLADIEGDASGFRVYGTSGAAPTAWYSGIDGSNNYKYDAGAWKWNGTTPEWPASAQAAMYPMNFYAAFPAAGVFTATASPLKITEAVAIEATAATQKDLLAAKSQAASKPVGGKLNLSFKHILSKVNFGIIAGNNVVPYLMSVDVMNIEDENTYDYVESKWNTKTPTVQADYSYFYGIENNIKTFAKGVTDEDVSMPFYAKGHSNNLMLMPQVGRTAWNPAIDRNNTAKGAYMETIYRLKTVKADNSDDNVNLVGWESALDYETKYPATTIGTWGAAPNDYTGIGTGAKEYEGQLFVKVGFPAAITWGAGKGYTYNLCLGTVNSTSGYYVSEYYYDEHGQETGIPVKGNDGGEVDPGDPVFDGDIHFEVEVDDWDDEDINLEN